MRKTITLGIVLLMIAMILSVFPIAVSASSTIYIKPDGTVDPASAPIKVNADKYTLTDNIYDSIVIQK